MFSKHYCKTRHFGHFNCYYISCPIFWCRPLQKFAAPSSLNRQNPWFLGHCLTFRLNKDFSPLPPNSFSVPAVRLSTVGRHTFPVTGTYVYGMIYLHLTVSADI